MCQHSWTEWRHLEGTTWIRNCALCNDVQYEDRTVR